MIPSLSLSKSRRHKLAFPRLSQKIDVLARYSSRSCGPICTGGHPAMRGATESKVRLASFCLAERQVSPSALRSPSPLASLLVPGRVHQLMLLLPSRLLRRTQTRARRISRYSCTSGSQSDGYISSSACGMSDGSLTRANELGNVAQEMLRSILDPDVLICAAISSSVNIINIERQINQISLTFAVYRRSFHLE